MMDPRDSSGTDEEEEEVQKVSKKLKSGIPETANDEISTTVSEEKKKKKKKLNDNDNQKESGRARVKRYRREVAGKRWMLPEEKWGKEELLKEWFLDRSSFDAALIGSGRVMAARAALVEESRRRANSSSNRITIHNSC